MNIHKINAVIFDIGNVLVFFNFPKMVAQIAACTHLPSKRIVELLIQHGIRDQYEKGIISNDDLVGVFRKASVVSFTDKDFFEAASDIFSPNEACYPLLVALKEKGVKLIALSNTNRAHFEYLKKHYPFLQLFDRLILSYEMGIAKPNPRIFEMALQEAGCPPHECFYTDDVPEYVEIAQKYGIDAELFKDTETLKSHLSARALLI